MTQADVDGRSFAISYRVHPFLLPLLSSAPKLAISIMVDLLGDTRLVQPSRARPGTNYDYYLLRAIRQYNSIDCDPGAASLRTITRSPS